MHWPPEKKALVHRANEAALPTTEVRALIEKLRDLTAIPPTSRLLAGEMSGESLTFVMQLSLRASDVDELHQALDNFSGLAVSLLIAAGCRRDRAGRSGLALAVSKALG